MFSFNTPKTVTGFTLPTSNTASATSLAGGAGDNKAQSKPVTLLFGAQPTQPTQAPQAGFALPSTAKSPAPNAAVSFASAPSFSLTSTPASTTGVPQFSMASLGVASTPASVSTVSAAPAASTTSFTPIFGTASAAAPTLSSLITATTAPAASTGSNLKLSSSLSAAASSAAAPGFSLSTSSSTALVAPTSTTTSTTSISSTTGQLSFAQLEDSINKWSIDLEEQGKFFTNQAKQLNAWDNLLLSNADKILALNDTIERVKQQQKQLDQELDFVLAQQNELDELSLPLEKQLADIPVTDQNRFQMYQLSEVIDSQLKQMSEDLKEVVEQLNDSNKEEDISDPVIQISKILNAHMNSLQWVDRNTSQITSHLEQISKMHEINKKNHLNM